MRTEEQIIYDIEREIGYASPDVWKFIEELIDYRIKEMAIEKEETLEEHDKHCGCGGDLE